MNSLWSARDLVEATGGVMTVDFAASGVSIDTRTIAPGDLFIALLGETGDGHAFVPDALAKGAAGAVVHHDIPQVGPAAARLLRVDDTLAALTRLGAYARARFTGRLVAITGSVGKTTTKEMLRRILAAFGPTHAAVASYNNHWGVPLTLARLPPDARFCVAEIGMNHAGEIAPLARLARPHVALITTIEKAHVGHLGSIVAIAAEKASILHGLQPDGVAVLPIDNALFPMLRNIAEGMRDDETRGDGMRIVTFGTNPTADACLVAAENDADGSDMSVRVNGTEARLRIDAPGPHMTMNALAALAGAAAMGADVRMAAGALAGFAPVAGRGARREIAVPGRPMPNGTAPDALPPDATILRGSPADTIVPGPTPPGTTMPGAAMQCVAMSGTTMSDKAIPSSTMPSGTALLLDESYNGNGASMRAALAVLRLQPARRRIAVLGDMLELGDEGPAEHLALADAVSRSADLMFACGPLMRGLYEAVPERMRAGYATDSTSLALLVARGVRPGDAILVKGSLGTRMKRVVDALDALGSGG